MQKGKASLDTSPAAYAASSPPLHHSRSTPSVLPTPPTHLDSNTAFFYSLFQDYSPNTTSETASLHAGESECRFYDESGVLEYQELYNRYIMCLAQLRDSIEEIDSLCRENDSLRLANADLSHRVALLFSPDRVLAELNQLNIASPSASTPLPAHVAYPQDITTEENLIDRSSTERVSLPKSISVRSRGYLKITRPGRDMTLQKTVRQSSPTSQRVFVPGTNKLEDALELDVYNQGMFKTELCNKWQQTGKCPYGENCQFAHGMKELRPVIRHPRYKTEVCRMVLAGSICPYGHRCHFRHSLTVQERLIAEELLQLLPPLPD